MKNAVTNNGVSIVICCHNSASRLPETLKHIALQEISLDITWEVILVNNNSSDNTVELAKEKWTEYNCRVPLTFVEEKVPGLSFARKRGIDSANFEYLIFCDDDNWLAPDYVKCCYNLFVDKKDIGIIGGRIDAKTENVFPYWFSSYQCYYAVGVQALTERDISSRGYVWGAGMAVRRSIFVKANELGFKLLLTDRKGNSLSSGGDAEFSKWALLLGYKLWYSEQLQLTHFIAPERLFKEYLQELQTENKKCDYWFKKYDILIGVKNENINNHLNFYKGIKLYLIRRITLSLDKDYLTRAQFMIGSKFRISSVDDFKFIKTFGKALYIDK